MRLLVVSHKECWYGDGCVWSTGGFPAQIGALAEIGSVRLFAPTVAPQEGGSQVRGVELAALPTLRGVGWKRRVRTVWWAPRVVLRLLSELRRVDLAYCLVPGDVGFLGILAARMARTPLVVRHCGTWGNQRTRAEQLLNVVLNRVAGSALVMATGWASSPPESRGGNVEWIFSSSYWSHDMESITIRDRNLADDRPLRLVTAGRQVEAKGTPCCIRALPLMAARGLDPELDVLGDGPALDGLVRLADELGVSERVRFWGRVPSKTVVESLSRAHIFLFATTSNEGFPKVVGEAMACGLPVVSTSVSALEMIVPGAGELLHDADPSELAAAVERLVTTPGRYEAASGVARHRAMEFTLDRWLERFVGLACARFPALPLSVEKSRGA